MSYSLDDLPTYNVTINLNLPEIKPLKEPVQKPLSKCLWEKRILPNCRPSDEPWIWQNFERQKSIYSYSAQPLSMPFGSLLKKLKIFFSVFWHYKMPNKLISFLKIGNRYFWKFSRFCEFEFKISRRKHLIQHCQQNFLSLIRFLFVVTCPFLVVFIFTDQGSPDRIGLKIISVGRIRNRFHCVPNTWFIIRCFISNHWNIFLWM